MDSKVGRIVIIVVIIFNIILVGITAKSIISSIKNQLENGSTVAQTTDEEESFTDEEEDFTEEDFEDETADDTIEETITNENGIESIDIMSYFNKDNLISIITIIIGINLMAVGVLLLIKSNKLKTA